MEKTTMESFDMKADKVEQKNLLNQYLEIVSREVWSGNEHMLQHERKTTARIFMTADGDLIQIVKPSIETKFCFGYSDSPINTDDYDRANDMAHHAKNDPEYFLQKNREGLLDIIKRLSDGNYDFFVRTKYYNSPEDSRVKFVECKTPYEIMCMNPQDMSKYKRLSCNDRNNLVKAYQIVLADFEKRLSTYLKKYGMSRIKTWTYWRDE